uniref:mitochondrial inner membrane protease subunit 2-like n=1 Tax=Erigeron canadensis TaxID=72917 RepID=UPI001CB941A1|nr:mitochondrial inner membrane protease subunit 2-like [Erigeron canadensis]XP_043610576.1 mitochondrial inner membrane protease subunit 2-like [Erigeron canadensis]
MWKEALKKYVGVGLVGITLTDRYAGVCPVRGSSMSPTFNPSSQASFSDDYVFLEKFCLDKYRFSHGDVVYFSNPTNFKERNVKRIVAMQGDYIANVGGAIKVPEGHCWVEGDNSASSYDSRSFGPIPLGLIQGRVTHVIWPPQRIKKVDRRIPQEGGLAL